MTTFINKHFLLYNMFATTYEDLQERERKKLFKKITIWSGIGIITISTLGFGAYQINKANDKKQYEGRLVKVEKQAERTENGLQTKFKQLQFEQSRIKNKTNGLEQQIDRNSQFVASTAPQIMDNMNRLAGLEAHNDTFYGASRFYHTPHLDVVDNDGVRDNVVIDKETGNIYEYDAFVENNYNTEGLTPITTIKQFTTPIFESIQEVARNGGAPLKNKNASNGYEFIEMLRSVYETDTQAPEHVQKYLAYASNNLDKLFE